MLGAIAGDVIGSVHERRPTKTTRFTLFDERCRVTDDTVMTVATARAVLRADVARAAGRGTDRPVGPDPSDYAHEFRALGRRYPNAGYGGNFRRWLHDESMGAYHSWGNGSAMRVSPVGWAFSTEADVLDQAERSARPTHDHPEGVKGARAVALSAYLARTGCSKDEIRSAVADRFGYDLDRTVESIRPRYRFDVSCQGSVPEAIISFLESTDTEDAIRLAVSLGGDADTQACIAGAIAEAHYGGVGEEIARFVLGRLDDVLLGVLARFADRLPEASAAAIGAEAGRRGIDPSEGAP